MKLKIVHQNQVNRLEQHQSINNQAMDMEKSQENHHVIALPAEHDENSAPISHSIVLSGKRKRKPKSLIDQVSPIFLRNTNPSKSKRVRRASITPVQLKSPTLIRAEEVQSNLGGDLPCFLKPLVRSHVGSCFWMGLPVMFCKQHLPGEDATAVLENEDGEEFEIKYIANKTGLSAGWRKFVTGNKLIEGDVLVFQLIGPCRFKVYIVRANDLNEVDGALSLLILDSQKKQSDPEGTMDPQRKKKRRPKSLSLMDVQKNKQEESPLCIEFGHPEEHSGNDSDGVASEVLEGSKFSGSSFHFKDLYSFENFRIVVNGVCIDSELPEHIRRKYYEICCSRNTSLHDRVLPGLYSKLAAGMIVETVNIADAIRCCNITTPRNEFEVWEKSLRSFELLGLNVGFLKARLRQLMRLAFDSEDALDARRYRNALTGKNHIEDEIRDLEAKLVELKELSAKYDHDIENLKTKAKRFELDFQEEVNAPW